MRDNVSQIYKETERKKKVKCVIDHLPFSVHCECIYWLRQKDKKRITPSIIKETTISFKSYMESNPSQTSNSKTTCQLVHSRVLCAVCGAPAIGIVLLFFYYFKSLTCCFLLSYLQEKILMQWHVYHAKVLI